MSNVPKLRFSEFSEEWEEKTLGEIFERVTTKNKENNKNVLTISAQQGLINQEEFFNKSVSAKDVTNYYLITKNDFAYNKSYSNGYPMGAIKKLNKYEKGVVSTLYICFRISNDSSSDNFYEKYFDSGLFNREIEKIAQEGARNHGLLNVSVVDFFSSTILPSTSKQEQEKIASFLTLIESRIEQLTKKESLLQKYKKGVMNKIFNQEIRFKDDNGNEFPEWEEKKLGEIGKFKSGTGFPEAEQGGKIGIPFYKVSDMNLPSNEKSMSISNNYVTEKQIEKLKLKVIKEKAIIFAKVGAAIFLERKRLAEDFLIDNNMMAFISTENIYYIKQLFFIIRFSKYAQVGALPSYNASDLEIIKIQLPCFEEQTKIANFLSSIDKNIELLTVELNKSKEFKQALLQKMFV